MTERSPVDPAAVEAWLRRELAAYEGVWFVRHFSSYFDPSDVVLGWLERNWRPVWASPALHPGTRLYHFVTASGDGEDHAG